MYQFNVKDFHGNVTRLQYGCSEPAYIMAHFFEGVGYEVSPITYGVPVERSNEELQRVNLLMELYEISIS